MKVETQQVVTFDDGSKLIVPQHIQDFVREALAEKNTNHDSNIAIHAINFIRAEFDLSTKNAKDLVDYWRDNYDNYKQLDAGTLRQLLRDKLDRQSLDTAGV